MNSPSEAQTVVKESVEGILLDFLKTRTRSEWRTTDDLFATGGMSSLFAMELVLYVEQTFGVVIGGEDLSLANFRTVAAMSELVTRLGGAPDTDGA